MKVRNLSLYNNFLTDISQNYNNFMPEERIQILQCFSKIGLKQQDFLVKNLETISANINQYKYSTNFLFQSLIRIGAFEEAYQPSVFKIIE